MDPVENLKRSNEDILIFRRAATIPLYHMMRHQDLGGRKPGIFNVVDHLGSGFCAKLEGIVVINVTTPGGGDTTAADALEFTATLYGKPAFTPAEVS